MHLMQILRSNVSQEVECLSKTWDTVSVIPTRLKLKSYGLLTRLKAWHHYCAGQNYYGTWTYSCDHSGSEHSRAGEFPEAIRGEVAFQT